jgi:hypothetical protein
MVAAKLMRDLVPVGDGERGGEVVGDVEMTNDCCGICAGETEEGVRM